MELKDKLKGKLKEIEALTEELNELLEELTDEPEEKKDKIELLDEYMKSLDERLFVEDWVDTVDLSFRDNENTECTLAWIWVDNGVMCGKEFEEYPGLFNELLKYKYAFKGKYDELFKEDDND